MLSKYLTKRNKRNFRHTYQRRQCEDGDRDEGDVAGIWEWRGVLAVMRRYEKQDVDSPPGLLGDHGSVDTWNGGSELAVSCETVDYMWPKVKYRFFFSS